MTYYPKQSYGPIFEKYTFQENFPKNKKFKRNKIKKERKKYKRGIL